MRGRGDSSGLALGVEGDGQVDEVFFLVGEGTVTVSVASEEWVVVVKFCEERHGGEGVVDVAGLKGEHVAHGLVASRVREPGQG